MGKSFRFLLGFAWINLGAVIAFAVIVVAGCYVTGVPGSTGEPGTGNLFETYYAMFPTMILLCLFLYAFGLCTSNLDLGLSMGAKRTDFFWAIQGIMVFYAAACWALQWLMAILPVAANWAPRERWSLLNAYSGGAPIYPALCLVVLVLGCLGGLLIVKRKVLGMLAIVVAVLVMIGVTVFMLLTTDTRLRDLVLETEWAWLWTALPKIVAGVLAVSVAVGEAVIWRAIHRHVVR